jgi:general secretion pathway protein G
VNSEWNIFLRKFLPILKDFPQLADNNSDTFIKRSYLHNEIHNQLKSYIIEKKYLKTHTAGFTLIEVMIVIALVGILSSIGVPNYIKYREKARIAVAITEIKFIGKKIANFAVKNGELPEGLSEIGMDKVLDPWDRPYQYLKTQGICDDKDKGDKGKPRKDHSLHPLNCDFDLYSVGKDAKSTAPLRAKISQDDIIRANNGGFVGLVSNY